MSAIQDRPFIPLSSDTETKPTAAMRVAIANAEVGDEQRGEDPTFNRLQDRVAGLLGKEAAFWFPGGTMCNFVAIKVHTRPADAIVADWMSHILRAESAGVALSSGVLIEPIVTQRGIFTGSELREALERLKTVGPPYGPPAKLVCFEQTHNFAGGTFWTLAA
jgi:threonine aldolase